MNRSPIYLVIFSVLWVPKPIMAEAPYFGDLYVHLRQNSRPFIRRLNEADCRYVGVLKFRLHEKMNPHRWNDTASINRLTAEYIEKSLQEAQRSRKQGQGIQLLRDASQTAAKIPGANHLRQAGQRKLLSGRYELANGQGTAKADALITGEIELKPDQKSMEVRVFAIKSNGSRPQKLPLAQFTASTTGIRSDLGVSFHRRLGSAGDETSVDLQQSHPQEENPLVTFQIFYDDKPVKVGFNEYGDAQIAEPQPGQRVKLTLHRKDESDRMLSAIVRVNGEDVLERARKPDLATRRYSLVPKGRAIDIAGFQNGLHEANAFKIASRPRSKQLEMYYGTDVGTISLTVFQQLKEGEQSELNVPYSLALASGQVPSPDAQHAKLEVYPSRGVIESGERIQQAIRFVKRHNYDPVPVLSWVVHYYRPDALR